MNIALSCCAVILDHEEEYVRDKKLCSFTFNVALMPVKIVYWVWYDIRVPFCK